MDDEKDGGGCLAHRSLCAKDAPITSKQPDRERRARLQMLQVYYGRQASASMDEDMLETLVNQTLDGALATIPMHLQEIEQNREELKVDNPKEFVYGLVMGMALAMGSALLSSQSGDMPTPEDQMRVRDTVYKKIPDIRARIFG